MAYRKGYYKKDGTYVQGHYIKPKSKFSNNKKNMGCINMLLILFFLCLSTYLINLI